MLSLRSLSLGLAFTSLVVACDAPTAPLDQCNAGTWLGSFNGNANGSVTDSLAGCAYYNTQPGEPEPLFGLVLTDGNPEAATLKVRIWIPRGPGANPIAVGDGIGQVSGVVLVGDREFTLTSGTITYHKSFTAGPGEVSRGVVDLTAVESGSGDTVTVTGDYLARPIATGAGPVS